MRKKFKSHSPCLCVFLIAMFLLSLKDLKMGMLLLFLFLLIAYFELDFFSSREGINKNRRKVDDGEIFLVKKPFSRFHSLWTKISSLRNGSFITWLEGEDIKPLLGWQDYERERERERRVGMQRLPWCGRLTSLFEFWSIKEGKDARLPKPASERGNHSYRV